MKSLDLAREPQRPIRRPVVVEWFDSESVARDEESLCAAVPDQEREHAQEVIKTFLTPAFIGGEHDLRIGLAAVRVVAQFGAQFEIVIDFAVENDPPGTVLVRHRLMPGRREVNDTQAVVTQTRLGGRIHVEITLVRAAMMLDRYHGRELRSLPALTHDAGNSAHTEPLSCLPFHRQHAMVTLSDHMIHRCFREISPRATESSNHRMPSIVA